MRIFIIKTLLLSVFLFYSVVPAFADLTLVVVSDEKEVKELTRWGTLSVYLEKKLEEEVDLEIVKSRQLQSCLESKCGDIFLSDPSFFAANRKKYSLVALATRVSAKYGEEVSKMGTVIVALRRRNLVEMEDLKKRRVLLPKTENYMTRFALWRLLLEMEYNPDTFFLQVKETLDSRSAVHGLFTGEGNAAILPAGAIESMRYDDNIDIAKLNVIHRREKNLSVFPYTTSTRLYPEWPIYTSTLLPKEKRSKIKKALLDMPSNSAVSRVTKIIGWVEPLSYDEVYRCLVRVAKKAKRKNSTLKRLEKLRTGPRRSKKSSGEITITIEDLKRHGVYNEPKDSKRKAK